MKAGKLFGTDGIRGLAYEAPLDRATVGRVGRALARNLGPAAPRILIGRDTRSSGPDLETWLGSGIAAGGGAPVSAGVLTTPAIAHLTRSERWDAGVVLSASHNPYRDNGIKIFTSTGTKTDEALEERIELDVASSEDTLDVTEIPSAPTEECEARYIEHLIGTLGDATKLPRCAIALDCANGAGYRLGPRLLRELGLSVVPLGVSPNGENINEGCGSTHMDALSAVVVEQGLDFGAALDGDGDRLLLVDSQGRFVDGDAILLMCGRRLAKEGRLAGNAVVATVMSNMALEIALAELGIRLHRTRVGDKYVAQEMTERTIIVGGEQSGHIIFADYAATGDGLLTLMQVLRVLALEGRSLDELGRLEPFPQVLVNVRVRERPDVHQVPLISDAIAKAEQALDGRGRVLIRYSGTEPLLRIMMEGPDREEIGTLASEIGAAAERAIGASE